MTAWTRDDLPSAGEARDVFMETPFGASGFEAVLAAVVAHLNAHHPKPDGDLQGDIRTKTTTADLATAERWRAAFVAADKALQQAERERDEWRESADKWHGEWQKIAPVRAVTRADIDRALINVTSNAMNYPNPSQMLGKDTGPLRKKCVDAMCDLLGIDAETADPVEEKARSEADRRYSGEPNHAFIEGAMWAARHAIEQEADQ